MNDISLDSSPTAATVRKPSDLEAPLEPSSPSPALGPEQTTALLFIARADALLCSLQRTFNELIFFEIAFSVFTFLAYWHDPPAYFSFYMHSPHMLRAIAGYTISSFIFPDLISRLDGTTGVGHPKFHTFFKEFLMEFAQEAREQDKRLHPSDRTLSSRRNKVS